MTARPHPSNRSVTLAPGLVVAYPEPSSQAATSVGRGNRRVDSRPEIALRSELHRRGFRFRKDLLVRVAGVHVHVDIAFTRARLAVFVDGCFWHSCPQHGRAPRANESYWLPKLEANRRRDRVVNQALSADTWQVVRVWEHEPVAGAADKIENILRSQPQIR